MKYYFVGAKGGQGTTVTAAAFALTLAQDNRRVLLVDHAPNKDMADALGLSNIQIPANAVMPVNPSLDFTSSDFVPNKEYDDEVVDLGVIGLDAVLPTDGMIILVTTSCYLALKQAIIRSMVFDRVILITEDGRALQTDDIRKTLGRVDVVIPRDPVVARAVDAGLFATRPPVRLSNALRMVSA